MALFPFQNYFARLLLGPLRGCPLCRYDVNRLEKDKETSDWRTTNRIGGSIRTNCWERCGSWVVLIRWSNFSHSFGKFDLHIPTRLGNPAYFTLSSPYAAQPSSRHSSPHRTGYGQCKWCEHRLQWNIFLYHFKKPRPLMDFVDTSNTCYAQRTSFCILMPMITRVVDFPFHVAVRWNLMSSADQMLFGSTAKVVCITFQFRGLCFFSFISYTRLSTKDLPLEILCLPI